MARPTIEGTKEQWLRVAKLVRERRESIPLTHKEAVETVRAGSISTWSAIERAERDRYTRHSLVTICRALGWTNDSIERILNGQKPIVAEDPDLARRVATLERQFQQMIAAIGALRSEIESPRSESRRAPRGG